MYLRLFVCLFCHVTVFIISCDHSFYHVTIHCIMWQPCDIIQCRNSFVHYIIVKLNYFLIMTCLFKESIKIKNKKYHTMSSKTKKKDQRNRGKSKTVNTHAWPLTFLAKLNKFYGSKTSPLCLLIWSFKCFPHDFVDRIYSIELEIKDYLDLHLEIDSEDWLWMKLYNKRDNFNFPIVNYPYVAKFKTAPD